jgi:hypothetical protein
LEDFLAFFIVGDSCFFFGEADGVASLLCFFLSRLGVRLSSGLVGVSDLCRLLTSFGLFCFSGVLILIASFFGVCDLSRFVLISSNSSISALTLDFWGVPDVSLRVLGLLLEGLCSCFSRRDLFSGVRITSSFILTGLLAFFSAGSVLFSKVNQIQ